MENKKQRFSLRKNTVGVVSVLVGLAFVSGVGSQVTLASDTGSNPPAGTETTGTEEKVTSEQVKTAKEASDKAASDVKTQEGVVDTATKAKNTKQDEINALTTRIDNTSNAEAQIKETEKEKTTKESSVTTANNELTTAKNNLAEAERKVTEKETEKQTADRELVEKNTAKQTADSELTAAQNEKTQADRDVATKTNEKAQADRALETATKDLKVKEDALAAAQQKLREAEQNEAATNARKTEAQNEVNSKTNEVREARNEVDKAKKAVEDAEKAAGTNFGGYPTRFVATKEWLDAFKKYRDFKKANPNASVAQDKAEIAKVVAFEEEAIKAYDEYMRSQNPKIYEGNGFAFHNKYGMDFKIYVEFYEQNGTKQARWSSSPGTKNGGVEKVYDFPNGKTLYVSATTYEPIDASGKIYDPNNLPEDVLLEMNKYTATLINSLRQQLGVEAIDVNKNDIAFAKDLAKLVVDRNYNTWGHYISGINEVAVKRGLKPSDKPGEQYYENLYTGGLATPKVSKDDLYREIAREIKGFFFEGLANGHYEHAVSLTTNTNMGLAYSVTETVDPMHAGSFSAVAKLNDDGSVAIKDGNPVKVPVHGVKWHVIGVQNGNYVVDKNKAGGIYEELYGKNSAANVPINVSSDSAAAQRLTEAKNTLAQKEQALKTAQTALKTAQDKLAAINGVDVASVRRDVDAKQAAVNTATTAKIQAETNLTNIERGLDNAKTLATNAQNKVTAAQAKQNTAQSDLTAATTKAQQLQNELNTFNAEKTQRTNEVAAKTKALEDLRKEIADLQQKIDNLNADLRNLETLKNEKTAKEGELTTLTAELTNEQNKLVTLQQKAREELNKYNKVYAALVAQTVPTKELVDVPFTTTYKADDMLELRTQVVDVEGEVGKKEVTTTYTVSPTGEVTPNAEKTEVITQAPKTKVVKVGTKPTTQTSPVLSPKRYEADVTKDYGVPNEEVAGLEGESTVTTTYTVDEATGNVTPTVGQAVVTKAPTETVVKVGTKPTTKQVPVPSPEKRKVDSTLEYGKEEKVAGTDGTGEVTTTYAVDGATGVVTPTDSAVTVTTPPTDTIIKVGTKVSEAEVKKVEEIVDEVKKLIDEDNTLSAAEKERFKEIVSNTTPKDKLSTTVNSSEVSVTLDNSALNAEKLVVAELTAADLKRVEDTVAANLPNKEVVTTYDIRLADAEGNTVSKSGNTRAVTIAIVKADGEELEVYYVDGTTLEKVPSIYKDGQLTFFTDHFSTYTIIKAKKPTPGSDNGNGNNGGRGNHGGNTNGGTNPLNEQGASAVIKAGSLPKTETTTNATALGVVGILAAMAAGRRKEK